MPTPPLACALLKASPAVLCVLCGMANAAYQRLDGVFVVPVTAMKA